MTRRPTLDPAAEADLAEATRWYESERPGLGSEFLQEVDAILVRIGEFPTMHPVVYRGLRRALVRRFPYAVYYRFQGATIRVLACLHQRRDPRLARSRA